MQAAKDGYEISQKGRKFEPEVLIVPKGSNVSFPNRDLMDHNVFSLAPARTFDLALYESGATRTVSFDTTGVIPVFCNIHPQMRAHLIVVSNPLFGRPGEDGVIELRGVPPGDYTIAAWHRAGRITRRPIRVEANGTATFEISVRETTLAEKHTDKRGKPYVGY